MVENPDVSDVREFKTGTKQEIANTIKEIVVDEYEKTHMTVIGPECSAI